MWLVLIIAVLALFGLTVFRGAPYVPTHRRQIQLALDALPSGSVVLDLGSGDGAVLKAAAQRGHRAIGYEINPILCLIAIARCWRWRSHVQVRWRDFWLTPIEPQVDAVFIFAGGPFMKRLARKLDIETTQRDRPLYVISYAFEIPGQKPRKLVEGIHVYCYDKHKQRQP